MAGNNGLGGFASSTIVGLNTRRYHGLLTAATKPPVGRLVLLSKLEETLIIDGRRYDLSVNQYPGVVHPQGYRYLRDFWRDPFPTLTYRLEEIEIQKRIFMIHGKNATAIEYEARLPASFECSLELRPLIAFRDFHATTHHNDALDRSIHVDTGMVSITPYPGLPTLHFGHNGAAESSGEPVGEWYFNFEYSEELARGLDGNEDLFHPFTLRFSLRDGAVAAVIASTEPLAASQVPELRAAEVKRRENILRGAPLANPFIQQLTSAADQFIVQRGELNSVIAGYHWFGDWGRDTMIALPGLTLVTGRPEIARNILEAFAQSADRGMLLPNRFPTLGRRPSTTRSTPRFEYSRPFDRIYHTGDRGFVRERRLR